METVVRILIVADIHSNQEAFEAVLADAQRQGGFQEIWSLGDLVGYGPDPGACIALLRRYEHAAVAGNHDWATAGKLDLADFNPDAATACRWTSARLSHEDMRHFGTLPLTLQRQGVTLVHGSLRDPVGEYLITPAIALATFDLSSTPICLVGHSHIPFICRQVGLGAVFQRLPHEVSLDMSGRWIVNPGSVGQPRDSDPRASYILYDIDRGVLAHRRVEYDVKSTQAKMREAGLPGSLVMRLALGR